MTRAEGGKGAKRNMTRVGSNTEAGQGMGQIAHLDCSTGVSGDKFLGALLDIGEQTGAFTAEDLRALVGPLVPEAAITVERVRSSGIAAVSVRVRAHLRRPLATARGSGEAPPPPSANPPAVADNGTAPCDGAVPHRAWADIRQTLTAAALPAQVRARALTAFGELALAEARVHGRAEEEVHFHEVGAADSIVDIVGVCGGLAALGIEKLTATSVAVGSGTVRTSHGTLPVPAPATAILLAGIPVAEAPAAPDGQPIAYELTTPTGAALLRACAESFGPLPAMMPHATGYGAGTLQIGVPNVCQLVLGEPARHEGHGGHGEPNEHDDPDSNGGPGGPCGPVGLDPGLGTSDTTATALTNEAVSVLETNLDHLSPEALAFAAEQLLAEGALDVWATPIMMKKGRPAVTLSLLARREDAGHYAARMIALTGSLGVRRLDLERLKVPRSSLAVETPYGQVRFKQGAGRTRPEADDVARIAREQGRSFTDVAGGLERDYGTDHASPSRTKNPSATSSSSNPSVSATDTGPRPAPASESESS